MGHACGVRVQRVQKVQRVQRVVVAPNGADFSPLPQAEVLQRTSEPG